MLNSIRRGKDESLKRALEKWEENKQELSRQYSFETGKRVSNLKQLETDTEELEKKLNRESVEFRQTQTALQISIQDIQKQLNDDEVAVDFVSFRIFKKSWTESIMYGAYILKKNSPTPIFVSLCYENDLAAILGTKNATNSQELVTKLYRGGKESNASTTTVSALGENLYKLIWQPLEVHLNGVKKVNYVPAGKLFSIAFNALPTGKDQLLIDKYDLRQYTSSRELSLASKKSEKPKSIALFGDAKFTMDSTELKRTSASASTSTNPIRFASRGRDQQWDALPGTGKEVDDIEKLFKKDGIASLKYTSQSASESNLKKLSGKSPEILHLATHGFFIPIQSTSNNSNSAENHYSSATDPLLRNGILLAGANYTWSGKAPLMGAEDGVVTAYEISQLDLTNTKLVVLSACETALGDVQGTEGVFGLQRSFKMAGVEKLILSLWQVPDKETAELMKIFYSNWLGGKSIREAFTAAQTEMRNKNYAPYYWAAFVLIE